VCGDYLSPVEIPMLSEGGSASAYAATLARLEPLVAEAETVVPGHGAPLEGERARVILAEDAAYLEALASEGADAALPPGRRSAAQRQIHEENVGRAG
jgi:glyoxylase-like metal-dependent hydrolase (beta-lactamase superfamily II)